MPQAQLIITLEDNGSVSVNGPLSNQLLAYGLLESAKDAIRNYNVAEAEKRVQIATGPIPPLPLVGRS